MAFNSSYSDLQAEIALWTRRGDLTDRIPTFITLAEAQINRRLKDAKVVGRATASITDEYSEVPEDFGGVVTFSLDTSPPTALEAVAAHELDEIAALYWQTTGKPRRYGVVGSSFRFVPAPDETYSAQLTYYQRVPALSDSATSNWLLERHPDAYLYGALLQSAPFLRADERIGTWAGLFTAALDDIQTEVERDRFGARPARRMRSLG